MASLVLVLKKYKKRKKDKKRINHLHTYIHEKTEVFNFGKKVYIGLLTIEVHERKGEEDVEENGEA